MTIFEFPTLANPAALNEQELREELTRVNHQVLTLSSQLHGLTEKLNAERRVLMSISNDMARVVVERLKKEKGDVNAVIDEIIRRNVIVMPKDKGEVH